MEIPESGINGDRDYDCAMRRFYPITRKRRQIFGKGDAMHSSMPTGTTLKLPKATPRHRRFRGRGVSCRSAGFAVQPATTKSVCFSSGLSSSVANRMAAPEPEPSASKNSAPVVVL